MHAGSVAGDDNGVRCEVDLQRLVEVDRRGTRPLMAARPPSREIRRIRIRFGHKGFAQRYIELNRSGIGGTGTAGGSQHPARRRSPLSVESVEIGAALGKSQADRGAHLGTEVTQLFHGLVGTGAQQFVRTIGAQDDQRNAGVVGLDDGGSDVGHRRAGGHRNRNRPAASQCQTDGQVPGGPLIDPHMQSQPPRAVGVSQGEGQGCIA